MKHDECEREPTARVCLCPLAFGVQLISGVELAPPPFQQFSNDRTNSHAANHDDDDYGGGGGDDVRLLSALANIEGRQRRRRRCKFNPFSGLKIATSIHEDGGGGGNGEDCNAKYAQMKAPEGDNNTLTQINSNWLQCKQLRRMSLPVLVVDVCGLMMQFWRCNLQVSGLAPSVRSNFCSLNSSRAIPPNPQLVSLQLATDRPIARLPAVGPTSLSRQARRGHPQMN